MLQVVQVQKPYQPQDAQRVTQTAQEILAAQKEHAEFILSVYETKLELVEDDPA